MRYATWLDYGVKILKLFFNKAGFTIQEYQHSNVFEDLCSVKFLNLDREETLKIL